MRKRYLDMLRLFCVFLLIPFHTMMMYNTWGEGQYVPGVPLEAAGWFIRMTYPWLMPLMFVIAGMSARYSLQKRSASQFLSERFIRIGLPLLTGILIVTPFLSYTADLTNNNYDKGYFAHYSVFFSKWTDLSGYDGGFGLSHLWFLLYLLIISMAALPVFLSVRKLPRFFEWSKWPFPLIIALGAIQAQADNFLNFGGKSLMQYFLLFLIGMFALSHEEVHEKLERFRVLLLGTAFAAGAAYAFALKLEWNGLKNDMPYYSYGYLMLLAVLGFGRRYLNKENRLLTYAAGSSQLFYIFHYPVLTAAAYIFMPVIPSIPLQILTFIVVSFIMTVLISEAVRRIPVIRVLFGMKSTKH